MKQTNKLLTIFIVLLSAITIKMSAQCTNSSSYGSPTAPAPGTSITAVSCQYAGEYCTVSSVTAGSTYWIKSTIATDYFTIRVGASNGTLVAMGNSPLVFTPTLSGTYYIHCNSSSLCATASVCRNVLMGCYGPACTNSSAYGSAVAPAVSTSITITTCNYGGEYATVSSVVAGNYYVSSSSIATDYFTIRSGTSNGPVVASGLTPLTWTAQVAGTHYVHVNTNSLCATASSCRSNILQCTGPGLPPPAPANDLCSNATTLAIPSSTAGTTINATLESPAPTGCSTSLSQPGVWYKIVGNGNQIGADLCAASAWDSKIFVYSGSCGAWTCVASNDDFGPMCSSSAASATWCSVPGVNYFILATGYGSASAFTIAITQTVNVSSPTITATALTPSVCLGSAATLSATGATSYQWNTGATTASISITPTASGVYTVYGVGSTGCGYDIKTVTITSISNPTVTLSANNGSICPGGSFIVTASGASTYTFAGLPSGTVIATTATLSPLVNTNYTVSGTGVNGCKSLPLNSPTATVITLASPALTIVSSPSAVCPGVTASLTVSGANTYTWAALSSNATLVAVSSSATAIYTVSGTGTTVCNGVKTVTLTVYPTPNITAISGTLCAGDVFTTVPSGALTYTFSNGSNTISPLTSTAVNVVGTSSNGCVSTASAVANITVIALPVVTVNSGTTCNGSSFLLNPVGATSYTYVGNYANPILASVSGSYSVVGSTSLGCTSLPAVSNLTVYALPIISVAATPSNMEVCNTQSLSLAASGASTYVWNNVTSGASFVTTPTVNGSYFVIGTDVNGCVNAATVPYTVNPLPSVSISATKVFICQGGSSTLTAGGAITYTWSTSATTGTLVVNPTVTTIYSVVGTNTFGCVRTKTLTVGVNTIVITETPDTTLCLGNTISISAFGGSSYTWAPSPSIFGAVNVSPSVTTTYSYTTLDSKACNHAGVITVTVNPIPVVSATSSNSLICAGETATVAAAGASSYAWTAPTNTTGTQLVVRPNTTTVYMVTGTDINGCSSTASLSLAVNKCTGINEVTSGIDGLNIYPNPNNGAFTIELNNGSEKNIQIVDIAGRIVLSQKTSEAKANIQMNELANGIYYVKIQSNATVSIVKIIKQ